MPAAARTRSPTGPGKARAKVVAPGWLLLSIARGARRFSEITRTVDNLSDRLLPQRLKELVALGLVERTVVPTTPAHARYTLSTRGTRLIEALQPLARWGVTDFPAER